MSQSIYIYLRSPIQKTEKLLQGHIEEFETLLGDSFTDEEMCSYQEMIEQLASVESQEMLQDLVFDDFVSDPSQEEHQRAFFEKCKSSICLENVPYIENNPFQATYLIDLLWTFDEALIDLGGMSELLFKKDWLKDLKKLRSLDSLIKGPTTKLVVDTSSLENPLDALVSDIYIELNRINREKLLFTDEVLPEKRQVLLAVMQKEISSTAQLQNKSNLGLKDFGDALEGLKFYLKKIR